MNKNLQSSQLAKKGRPFPLTEEENRLIELAIKSSVRYMETYGQGRQPQMIDRKNYL